jgi:hypothetical protein
LWITPNKKPKRGQAAFSLCEKAACPNFITGARYKNTAGLNQWRMNMARSFRPNLFLPDLETYFSCKRIKSGRNMVMKKET